MISDLIGKGIDAADHAALDKAKGTADDLKKLLDGPGRTPLDLEKEKKAFTRGKELATPDGGPARVAVAPKDTKSGGDAPVSNIVLGKPIEFIHFGFVHHDAARTFPADAPCDDITALDASADPGRALYFRAALERETIFLYVLADAVGVALAAKEQKEGALGGLAKAAIDLVGGFGGNADAPESADLKAFTTKLGAVWDSINTDDIAYADLHEAGIKLHEVRANLAGYLRAQVDTKLSSAAKPPAGLLSHLPLIGDVPLPGPIGDIVGTFKKVSGKLHDVSDALIFGLTLAMQPAIEQACSDITIDAITGRRPRVYPVWYDSDQIDAKPEKPKKPFADFQSNGPLSGQLTDLKAGRDINQGIHDFISDRNKNINDAVEKPMEVIDFLSKEVKAAPGNKYLDAAFQAAVPQPKPDGDSPPPPALGGSEKLGELAVTTFYAACADDVPAFMKGFVESIFEYVFAVCVEFLRAVFRVLNGLRADETVNTDELVAAGSTHVLTHLVDFVTAKLGVDDLIKHHMTVTIPPPPVMLPAGINWPTGEPISAAPIAAELKKLLLDKATPYLKPLVEYAMSGLAERLNARRSWAGGSAMTMEVHLGQLPSELALLFRGLIGPLWHFLDDTLLEIVKDTVAKGMGPAANAIGLAGNAAGAASGLISNIQRLAKSAMNHAKDIESKAGNLIDALKSVSVDTSDHSSLDKIGDAAKALKNAVTSDPFAGGPPGGDGSPDGGSTPGAGFPANRKRSGKGTKIDPGDLDAMSDKNKWDDAISDTGASASDKASGGAS